MFLGRVLLIIVPWSGAGRFFGNVWASRYRERFWNDTVFSAVADISAALQEAYASGSPSPEHVSLAEASLRWMFWHSGMKSGGTYALF